MYWLEVRELDILWAEWLKNGLRNAINATGFPKEANPYRDLHGRIPTITFRIGFSTHEARQHFLDLQWRLTGINQSDLIRAGFEFTIDETVPQNQHIIDSY